MPIPQISDTIKLSDVYAGDANAGNGGDGFNKGDIYFQPSAYVANEQIVKGAHVDVDAGDHVWQKAYWEADDGGDGGHAKAVAAFLAEATNNGSGGDGGDANSNGDQYNESGGNTATATANTTAQQNTELLADQHATILAGVGGNGGNGNTAVGGDVSAAFVHDDPTSVSATLSNIDNHFGDIDLSHLGS
ncbi:MULTISPECIES: PE-PGRS family protein [unclassified Sinorhizobium]|uniref:PE-PGRS family protein n=1 Tax=unclassified Sinorhizobium TaxID=2613772 RepID=UPI00352538FD